MPKLSDYIFLKFGHCIEQKEVQATPDDVYKYKVVGSNKHYGYASYHTHEDVVVLASSTNYNHAGAVGYFKEKVIANDKCLVIHTKDGVLQKYVFYFLQARKIQLQRMSRGSIITHLPPERVLNMEFNPPNLHQQKRVVQALDSNQELSDLHAERARAGLELQASMLVDFFD
jgi:restriction endonuclease S subunit